MSSPESDFEDDYPSPQPQSPQRPQSPQPQRTQPQRPQSPQPQRTQPQRTQPQMRVIDLQRLPPLIREINGVPFYPGQLPIPQTPGESTAEYPLQDDPQYMQNRAAAAERRITVLERERDNMLSRFYELQYTCEKLREENEALRAQLATLQQTTKGKLRM